MRVDLLVTDRPITPSGTGRAVPRLCWSGAPTDGVQLQSSNHVIRSQVDTPVLPKLQRTSHSAVDPHGSSTTSLVVGAPLCRDIRPDLRFGACLGSTVHPTRRGAVST